MENNQRYKIYKLMSESGVILLICFIFRNVIWLNCEQKMKHKTALLL